jgi:hypothetical protein
MSDLHAHARWFSLKEGEGGGGGGDEIFAEMRRLLCIKFANLRLRDRDQLPNPYKNKLNAYYNVFIAKAN